MATPWESYLTPAELQVYNNYFNAVSRTVTERVTGQEAVQFFITSGVPNEILSEIWEAADRDNLGYLTRETFANALKLIACAQHGVDRSEPILATVVPLPQFEGYNAIPQPTTTAAPTGPIITPQEREKYLNIFRMHQPDGDLMEADKAKSIFIKSRLPKETLADIWDLANVRKVGNLNKTEFVVAMHYIAKLMDKTIKQLPSALPPSLYASAAGSVASPATASTAASILTPTITTATATAYQPAPVSPQHSDTAHSLGHTAFLSAIKDSVQLDATAQEKAQDDAFFDKLDVQRTGFVEGQVAGEFFQNSRLPSAELATIWSLADSQQRGKLNRDEFSLAMRLIRKRLRGELLPGSVPAGSVPQSSIPHLPGQSPSVQNTQPLVHQQRMSDQDLLSDFESGNPFSPSIGQGASVQTVVTPVQTPKVDDQQTLEQLLRQKQDLQAKLTQVQMVHEAEAKELRELQDKLQKEQPVLLQIKQEHDTAEQRLAATRAERAQLEQALQHGRSESERLRQEVSEMQEETSRLAVELGKLRGQLKQQNMMLDINRRQVTASEQDRDQAKRDLADFKAERNLPDILPDDEESAPSSSASPQPVEQKAAVTTSNAFDDVFSDFIRKAESTSSSAAASPTPSATKVNPLSMFDPVSWETSPERPAPVTAHPPQVTRTGRPAPPPPPPQSRLHRQVSDSHAHGPTHKPRAPPPPPPSTHKTQQPPSASTSVPAAAPAVAPSMATTLPPSIEDEFDALFSSEPLTQVRAVEAKPDDFADFDEAFASMDSAPGPEKQINAKTLSWASNVGGFDFADKPKEDDWDSIFGGPAFQPTKTDAQQSSTNGFSGFEDAFSTMNSVPKENKTAPFPSAQIGGTNNSNVDELVKMGFNIQQAKDALDRYDQNLEKASNFLLDQYSK